MAFVGDSSTSVPKTRENAGRRPLGSQEASLHGPSTPPWLATTERLEHPLPPDRVRQRRRQVLGMLLVLVVTAVPLCLLVMWSRDRTTVLVRLRPAREAQAAFQSRIDHLGLLPAEAAELDKAGLYYLFSDPGDREYARQCREKLVIAHGAAISLYLANKSRIVMTCEKGRIEVSLMPSLELIHLLERQTTNINAYFNQKTQ